MSQSVSATSFSDLPDGQMESDAGFFPVEDPPAIAVPDAGAAEVEPAEAADAVKDTQAGSGEDSDAGDDSEAGEGTEEDDEAEAPDPAAVEAVIDGKVFAAVANTASGEVGRTTSFHYRQDGRMIWAEYSGGAVVRGYLVGTRDGDRLDFRYSHLNINLQTANGVCASKLEVLDDGRIRLHETWQWESRPERGTSVVEEIPATT
ncbi:hypothetical protein [Arthrobacter crystallopoietes]|uniref:N-acetylglutamate synthase n=1 Tax=Crystallibacter crystallopoietes TaxID=37928 RepID=A0A1H0ZY86_9MICC|nr:hypothetical protein [Arthrobacter crystallopoietes]SDQ32211.1 hypothetical protein SAMN04489742_0629 [Arthrobacter crystallopoietes]